MRDAHFPKMSRQGWLLKCGVLIGDEQVGDFKCIVWDHQFFCSTLRQTLETAYRFVDRHFRVVYIDDKGDKLILPVDSVRESEYVLKFFEASSPIKIFIQLPGQKKPAKDEHQQEGNPVVPARHDDGETKIVDTLVQLEKTIHTLGERIDRRFEDFVPVVPARHDDGETKIVDTLVQLEKTIHTLGERIDRLFEDFGKSWMVERLLLTISKRLENNNKAAGEGLLEQSTNMAASQESTTVKESGSNSDAESGRSGRVPHFRSSESSTSSPSFSVQSQSSEDDWTRVRGVMNTDGRRRHLTTESSCTSHQSDDSQDEVAGTMEDNIITFDMLCRNP